MANAHVTTASVEFHTRVGEAQSVLDNIVMAHPVGSTIVDPTSLRVRLHQSRNSRSWFSEV